jgi:hypothetical protein
MVHGLGWIQACDLHPGDQLITDNGTIALDEISIETLDEADAVTVYNFHVRAFHTYYVCAGGAQVLVHNMAGHDLPAARTKLVENLTFPTRREAELAARERAGVGPDDVPDAEWTVGADALRRGRPGYRYTENPGSHGSYQQFETERGSRVIVRHTNDPNQGPHYHAGQPKGNPDEQGVNFGWDSELDFQRYRPVGGKHHLYYPEGE